MKLEDVLEDAKADPETFGKMLGELKTTICMYKAWKEGIADEIYFQGVPCKKEGGEILFEVFEQLAEEKEREEITELKQYWLDNYEEIKRVVYMKK